MFYHKYFSNRLEELEALHIFLRLVRIFLLLKILSVDNLRN